MMVLYRRGYGLYDQERLAEYFDIRVSEKSACAFTVDLKHYSDPEDAGMRTVESVNLVNRFFAENNIALVAEAVFASEIQNLGIFIKDNIKANRDLWVEYHMDRIHEGVDPDGSVHIHDGLIEGLICRADDGEIVALTVDPSGKHKPRFTVELPILKEAISSKYGRETGFIVIS